MHGRSWRASTTSSSSTSRRTRRDATEHPIVDQPPPAAEEDAIPTDSAVETDPGTALALVARSPWRCAFDLGDALPGADPQDGDTGAAGIDLGPDDPRDGRALGEGNRRAGCNCGSTPVGVAGDESDAMRKTRAGQFQGLAITVAGLSEIDRAFNVFQIPMYFESFEELYHVLAKLRPALEARLAAKGYRAAALGPRRLDAPLLASPIRTLDDLKQQKLFVWAGDDSDRAGVAEEVAISRCRSPPPTFCSASRPR